MNAYKARLLEDIADAVYAKDYCQRKAWEYVGMREDSTTAKDYFQSVKSWTERIDRLMELADKEKIKFSEIKNAVAKKYRAMEEAV